MLQEEIKSIIMIQKIETDYLKGIIDINEKYQRYTNWIFAAIIIVLFGLITILQIKTEHIRESVVIMQCEKDANKINATFYVSDGECNIIYSE